MRLPSLTLAVVTLTFSLILTLVAASDQDPFLIRRQLAGAPGTDESQCVDACEQKIAGKTAPAIDKCGEQANGNATEVRKCFCEAGIDAAAAGCLDKCHDDGSGHDALDAVKQRCAELGVGIGDGEPPGDQGDSGSGPGNASDTGDKAGDSSSSGDEIDGDNGGVTVGMSASLTLALIGVVAAAIVVI